MIQRELPKVGASGYEATYGRVCKVFAPKIWLEGETSLPTFGSSNIHYQHLRVALGRRIICESRTGVRPPFQSLNITNKNRSVHRKVMMSSA